MKVRIAVDLGGTHIRAAAYQADETRPLKHHKIMTRSGDENVFERLIHLIEEVRPANSELEAIGVAAPGPLNPHTGIVIDTPNIPEWENFPLTEKLRNHFDSPVFLGNDANLAGLGEWRFGAGQGHENLLYLTISTGVGGGVISHGCMLEGDIGFGAELGHVVIDASNEGPVCGCGQRGHLEALSSGTAIANYVEWRLRDPQTVSSLRSSVKRNAVIIAEAARAGDPLAIEAYERAGHYLGIGVASFLHIFNPSNVIFGGGVSQSRDLFWQSFEASLRAQVFNPAYLDKLVLTTAALGDDAGLLGALALIETKV